MQPWEVNIMKRLLLIVTFVVFWCGTALAGPNIGVTLTPHGNILCAETNGDVCSAIQLPAICHDTTPESCPDENGVEWFLAVATGDGLCFNTITFGIGNYDPYVCYVADYGPCFPEFSPLEIPSAGWPGPKTGTSVSWAPNCLCGGLIPVYYFGFYVYYAGGPVPFGDFYPGQTAAVVSCESPPEEDPIAIFGTMGCGADPGAQGCPGELLGACCVDTDQDGIPETCIPDISEIDCYEIFGGWPWFPETPCGPEGEPCIPPTPAQETTWGRIKGMYR
jgi:hypothetical protein